MKRFTEINPSSYDKNVKVWIDGIEKRMGKTPNMFKLMAHSPVTLTSYERLSETLRESRIDEKLREQIALTVAGLNGSEYCASAHTAIGKKLGLTEPELNANLRASSTDKKTEIVLSFVKKIVLERGRITDSDFEIVRKAGFNEPEIADIVTLVAFNTFSNYFTLVARPELDFPAVTLPEVRKTDEARFSANSSKETRVAAH